MVEAGTRVSRWILESSRAPGVLIKVLKRHVHKKQALTAPIHERGVPEEFELEKEEVIMRKEGGLSIMEENKGCNTQKKTVTRFAGASQNA